MDVFLLNLYTISKNKLEDYMKKTHLKFLVVL